MRPPGAIFALALVIGAGAAGAAILLRFMIIGVTEVFSGHGDPSALGHVTNPLVPQLGMWWIVLAPVAGALIDGPLVHRFAPETRGLGIPEVMYAVNELGGRMRPQVPIVKAVASALCIGSGGSLGREGPSVQIGSAIASVIGQAAHVPAVQLRLLVACGAAAANAATFNAPIAGVFFALELVMRDFSGKTLGPVVIAAVSGDALSRAVFGPEPFLNVTAVQFGSTPELLIYAGLGLFAAIVGVGFIRVLYGMQDVADRLWRWPEWGRPIAGSVLLGLALAAVPEMYGSGYAVLDGVIDGRYVVTAVIGLLAAKIVFASLTLAIGGSGGIFTPSLFMGAMLGSAYGAGAHALLPGVAASPEVYALVGMGAVFAAAARAPFTAGAMVFELTGEPALLLPLMVAVGIATALANLATRDTVYTMKLTRRGVNIDVPRSQSMMHLTVGEAMHAPREDGTGQPAPAGPMLRVDDSLDDAVRALARSNGEALPVTGADGGAVVGWLSHRDVLRVYHLHERPPMRDPHM
ncbi:chloride channel protein [soil metagenome]